MLLASASACSSFEAIHSVIQLYTSTFSYVRVVMRLTYYVTRFALAPTQVCTCRCVALKLLQLQAAPARSPCAWRARVFLATA